MPIGSSHIAQIPQGPHSTATPASDPMVHVFHMVGALVGTMSDDFPVMLDGTANFAYARLSTPGGSPTQITVFLNDVSIGVITIGTGQNVGTLVLNNGVSFQARDWFNVQVTSFTSGCGAASGLWVGVYV